MIKYPLCHSKIVSESDFNVLVNHYHNGSEIRFRRVHHKYYYRCSNTPDEENAYSYNSVSHSNDSNSVLVSNPVLSAHTFSENENALFLTMIDNIKAETQVVARDFQITHNGLGTCQNSSEYTN